MLVDPAAAAHLFWKKRIVGRKGDRKQEIAVEEKWPGSNGTPYKCDHRVTDVHE